MTGGPSLVMSCAAFIAIDLVNATATPPVRSQDGRHGYGHAKGNDIYKLWSPPNNLNTSC